MTTSSDPRICIRCNRDHRDPGYFPVHDAQYENTPMMRPEPEPPTTMPMPFDPVLRQALLSKGIITLADIAEAEQMIRATTGQLVREMMSEVLPHGSANG